MTAAALEGLLALQDLDTKIDQERHRQAHLPERARLAEIESQLAEAGAARFAAAEALQAVASRQGEAERDLQATEQRVKQVNAVLYGGTVSASRELQAMAADLDGLKKRASELEDKVLALLEEREPLDEALSELDARLARLRELREAALAELVAAEKQVGEEVARLEAGRPALAAAVPADLLGTYERLRARLGGVAVARLVGGRCDGCHLSLPAVDLDRIRHQPEGQLENCEQCGRILVFLGG
jgi:predicted  nucleic acid-binding Zn-ribbon protein